MNTSGFDKTMKTESKMGPVYDGENIIFYHKDFSNCTFWNEHLTTANWNREVQESITKSEEYKWFQKKIQEGRKPKSTEVEFWNTEKAKKNNNMFPEKHKVCILSWYSSRGCFSCEVPSYDWKIRILRKKKSNGIILKSLRYKSLGSWVGINAENAAEIKILIFFLINYQDFNISEAKENKKIKNPETFNSLKI